MGDLKGMMVERLEAYHRLEHHWPQHILFYRDGVGESQFGILNDDELTQFGTAFDDIRRKGALDSKLTAHRNFVNPLVTLIIVGKRHHTRFYPRAPPPLGATNLRAGSTMDKDVVTPYQFSLYHQSHDALIGTARSGHYVVVQNGSNYTAQQLQEIVSPQKKKTGDRPVWVNVSADS